MSLWMGVLVLVIGQSESTTPVQASPAESPRNVYNVRDEASELFKWESQAATEADRVVAVRRLAELHREITSDPRFVTSPTLQTQRGRIAARLIKVRNDYQRRIDAAERRGESKPTSEDISTANSSYASAALGGPNLAVVSSSFGGGTVEDNGRELIELIQNTIRPEHWDVNGGPGTMFFYRPANALVVRAAGEIHGELGGGLKALRDAGK